MVTLRGRVTRFLYVIDDASKPVKIFKQLVPPNFAGEAKCLVFSVSYFRRRRLKFSREHSPWWKTQDQRNDIENREARQHRLTDYQQTAEHKTVW